MKAFKTLLIFFTACIALIGILSCGSGGSDTSKTSQDDANDNVKADGGDTGEDVNAEPVADAGPDLYVLVGFLVSLDGSKSKDAEDKSLSYKWSFDSKPAGSVAALLNATSANPMFTADIDGSYILSLKVNDGSATSQADTVKVTTGDPVPVPDSGQTDCYDTAFGIINCTSTGQDGEFSANPMSFTDNGDGTVTDNVTGLMWQKCSAGLTNDATCSGTFSTKTWQQSVDYCDGLSLGGYSDWRLPREKELVSIVVYGNSNAAIDDTFFPNTDADRYWSSTSRPSSVPLNVNFSLGYIEYFFGKTNNFNVRCVRGNPAPEMNFTDNGNGTVTDNVTGLMWQKCSAGLANDATCSGSVSIKTWQPAVDYCNALSLGGHSDWRLPDIKELYSMVDESASNPAINIRYFPNTSAPYYWSSTTYPFNPSSAWSSSANNSYTEPDGKTSYGRGVRCVR